MIAGHVIVLLVGAYLLVGLGMFFALKYTIYQQGTPEEIEHLMAYERGAFLGALFCWPLGLAAGAALVVRHLYDSVWGPK